MKTSRWLAAVLVGIVVVGWQPAVCPAAEVPPAVPAKAVKPLHIVCLGDSITEGFGIKEPRKHGYPGQLQALLGDRAKVDVYGAGGTTYFKAGQHSFWKTAWLAYVKLWQPQVVTLAFGTNCSRDADWPRHKDSYVADVNALIDTIQASVTPAPRIYLCLPPPAYSDKWTINEKALTDEVIPRLRQVATERKFAVINLHAALAGKPESFQDTIHPTPEGMKVIAETLAAALVKAEPQLALRQRGTSTP